jgi:hypothetical protein
MPNRQIGDFTFGGQLFEAYWHMFVSSLKPILYVAALPATATLAVVSWTTMHKDDLYYLIMATFAKLWLWLGLNGDKLVNLRGYDMRMTVRMRNVDAFPPLEQALTRWLNLLEWTGLFFVLGAAIGLLVYPQVAAYIARKQRQRTNQRGAFITDAQTLRDMIEEDNRTKAKAESDRERARQKANTSTSIPANAAAQSSVGRAPKPAALDILVDRLTGMLGLRAEGRGGQEGEGIQGHGNYDLKAQCQHSSTTELAPKAAHETYRIAGFPFPWKHEATHFFAMGTTGAK